MGPVKALVFALFVVAASHFSGHVSESTRMIQAKSVEAPSPNHLLLEALETDSGVGGTNQFVFLRVFSDQTVEFHPKRSQDLRKTPVVHEKIPQADIDRIQSLLAQDDVAKLSKVFSSTFTPIDFYWTLDFKIPRGTRIQQVKLVNFSPQMAKRNNKPYSEGLLKLACTVLILRQDMQAETPDLRKDCQDFVPTK